MYKLRKTDALTWNTDAKKLQVPINALFLQYTYTILQRDHIGEKKKIKQVFCYNNYVFLLLFGWV
jgi:hypothetical protein